MEEMALIRLNQRHLKEHFCFITRDVSRETSFILPPADFGLVGSWADSLVGSSVDSWADSLVAG